MRHGRYASSSAATVDASDNASLPYHNPQSQVPIPNNPNPLLYGHLAPQIPGQHLWTQSGDIRQMSAVQSAFMNNQMVHMLQEMDSEFSEDNDEQNASGPEIHNDDTSQDHHMSFTREQSLSADFNRLTMEERVSSSSRSVLVHGSSSTTVRADQGPKHIIIPGDYTEVDNNFYQNDFDSHKVQNNIVENSFGDGKQNGIRVWQMLAKKSKQAHNPGRR